MNLIKKNKKNNSNNNSAIYALLCIIILLCVIVGLLSFKIIFSKNDGVNNSNNSSNSSNNTASETEVVDKDEEKDLTDHGVHDLLSVKIDNLFGSKKYDGVFFGYGFRTSVLTNSLRDFEKYKIAADHSSFHAVQDENWKNVDAVNNYVNHSSSVTEGLASVREVDLTEVNKTHNYYFGEDIKNPSEVPGKSGYTYDANSKRLYRVPFMGGGASPINVNIYKSRYTTTKEYAYVYISVGLLNDQTPGKIYNGFTIENNYFKDLVEYPNGGEPFVTNKNYKDFPEYKLVFKKDTNGNYYYVKTEKTK